MALEAPHERTIPRIISVDDHVIEPAHTWQRWLPSKFRDRGPRIERRRVGPVAYDTTGGKNTFKLTLDDEDGTWADVWFFEEVIWPHSKIVASVGFDPDDKSPLTYDEMRKSCYDPIERLKDMEMNHVESSLCFPHLPRFCGQTFYETSDRDLGLACVLAYNDFMIEEWCGDSAGGLIPLCLIPLWDVELAAAEVRRNATRGCRAVAFSELPTHLGLPSIHSGYWDPFFAACQESGTAVMMHIGSSSRMPAASPDAPPGVTIVLSFANSAASLVDFLMSGVLERFPKLKLAYAEGQIGWLPYVLERVDDVWHQHRGWSEVGQHVPEPPSSYYYRQVYGCFFRDRHGLDSLEMVGEDRILFETDFPHTDTTWPNTLAVAEKLFGHLPPETIYKISRGNAIELLGLDRH